MRLSKYQRGLGMWGWIYLLATMGFFVMVGMQLVPVYLQEMAIQRVVKLASKDSSLNNASPQEVRKALQTRWDVEGITVLDTKQVQLVKLGTGQRALAYSYDSKVDLFYNLAVVAHFENKFAMDGTGAVE